MSLTVCVSASSTEGKLALTSELRDFIGSTSTGRDTAQAAAIKAASRWVEKQMGYPLLAQVYSETVAGFGGRNLMLSRTPIISVLRFFNSTSTGTAIEICSSEFRIDAEEGMLNRDQGFSWNASVRQDLLPNIIPTEEHKPWLVEYSAGYFFPGESTSTDYGTTSTGASTLDDGIHEAVLMKANRFLNAPGNVKSESVGDFKVTYSDNGNDDDILALLPVRIF